jgi:hypothetical protein
MRNYMKRKDTHPWEAYQVFLILQIAGSVGKLIEIKNPASLTLTG